MASSLIDQIAAAAGMRLDVSAANAKSENYTKAIALLRARRGEARARQRLHEEQSARAHERIAAQLALNEIGEPELRRARAQVAKWVAQGTCSPWYAERWSAILDGSPAEVAARLLQIEADVQQPLHQNTPFGFLLRGLVRE